MGAGLVAFMNGRLRPGVEIVLEAVDFSGKIKDADLVVTGEGTIDSQTVHGKTPIGVSRAALHSEYGRSNRRSNALFSFN